MHRIGRTARAGATGVAVTFVDWQDIPRWGLINKALGLAFDDPIETYSTSEHLFTGPRHPRRHHGAAAPQARTREGLDAEVLEDLGGASRTPRPRRDGRGGCGSGGHGRGHTHHHGQTIPHGHKDGAAGGTASRRRIEGPDSGAERGGSGDEAAPKSAATGPASAPAAARARAAPGGQSTAASASGSAAGRPSRPGPRRVVHTRRSGQTGRPHALAGPFALPEVRLRAARVERR